MFKLPQTETKTLVAVHGWSAVMLGLLLYAVVLTGAVAVFAQEIGHWSIGKGGAGSVFERPIDAYVRKSVDSVEEKYRDDVVLTTGLSGDLRVWVHTDEMRPNGDLAERGTLVVLDPETGRETARRQGFDEEVFREPATALERFLVDAHVRLYLPAPWGLILTGVLGLAMMAAALSGLLMHRHLVRDCFTLRRDKATLVSARDEHSVAASWGLPFAFLVALTGAFFSFADSFGFSIMSMVAFSGDQKQMFEVLAGEPAAEDAAAVEGANLDAILRDARGRASGAVDSLSISHYGRRDAKATVSFDVSPEKLEPATLVFNAVDGTFEKSKPAVGAKPSLGAALYAVIGPVHFGNFAGVLSKLVWQGLGLATAFVIASGLSLWVTRRAADPFWRAYGRICATVIYGLPIALAASADGFLLTYPGQAALTATPAAFLIAAGGVVAYAINGMRKAGPRSFDGELMLMLGAALITLPVVRVATGGAFWPAAISNQAFETVGVDLALFFGGSVCLWFARKWRSRMRATAALDAHLSSPDDEQAGITY